VVNVGPQLSRTEFGQRLHGHRRRNAQYTMIGFAVGVVWLVAFPVALSKFGGSIGPSGGSVPKVVWVGGFIALLAIGPFIAEQKGSAAGLICPACNKTLQATSGMIAVASGRCGYCGADVCV